MTSLVKRRQQSFHNLSSIQSLNLVRQVIKMLIHWSVFCRGLRTFHKKKTKVIYNKLCLLRSIDFVLIYHY